MQRFTVIGRFPALNDIVAAAKQHWSAYSKEKAERTTYVGIMARAAKLTPITGRCMVRCLWYEKDKRRDPDNVRVGIKFILDGLVQAGILALSVLSPAGSRSDFANPPWWSGSRVIRAADRVDRCPALISVPRSPRRARLGC